MAVNGKNKGSSYERNISNLLSKRFESLTGIKSSFRRNADSGSFWGASNQKRIKTHDTDSANFGDIICPKDFKFSVECKHYKTAPSFSSILTQNCKQWDSWLSQAVQDSINSGKKMLLIIKYNNVAEFVVVSEQASGLQPAIFYKSYYVYTLKDFLNQSDSVFFDSEKPLVSNIVPVES